MFSSGSAGRSWSHSSTRKVVNSFSCICSISGSNSTPGSERSSIQSCYVSLIRSIPCDTSILVRPTVESDTSLKRILPTTKSSPYGLYFFLFLSLLPWRVSKVKVKSGSSPLSTSVCSGQSQSSSVYGKDPSSTSSHSVNSRSSDISQSSTTSFPSFLSRVLLSFASQAGLTIN